MRARALLVLLVLVPLMGRAGSARPDAGRGVVLPAFLTDSLALREDPLPLARLLGVRSIGGRRLDVPGPPSAEAAGLRAPWPGRRAAVSTPAWARPGRQADLPSDVQVASDAVQTRARPSVAAHPQSLSLLVAAYGAGPFAEGVALRCPVVQSLDGGGTWSLLAFLPQLSASSTCNDPAIVWSPEGQNLYAAYRDVKGSATTLPAPEGRFRFRVETDLDVVVSHSEDGGASWSAPIAALDADAFGVTVTCPPPAGQQACETSEVDPGSSYERPSLATPRQGGGSHVYVAATRFTDLDPAAPPTAIAFSVSSDGGQSWAQPENLDVGAGGPQDVVVQGPRVAGGQGGELIVAWYHSADDGPRQGAFEIRVRRSANHAGSWSPVVTAARDADELGSFLGPLDFYKPWWPATFPDVAFDGIGRVHLVYARDPEAGSLSAEEGDIRYVTSPRTSPDAWSAPVTVNDDGPGRAQGFARLTTGHQDVSSVVDVVWEDTRRSPEEAPVFPVSSNLYYDVFHARRVSGPLGGGRPTSGYRMRRPSRTCAPAARGPR